LGRARDDSAPIPGEGRLVRSVRQSLRGDGMCSQGFLAVSGFPRRGPLTGHFIEDLDRKSDGARLRGCASGGCFRGLWTRTLVQLRRSPASTLSCRECWEVAGSSFLPASSVRNVQVVWTTMRGRPKKSDLKALGQVAERHRLALLEEWHAKVNGKAPGPER